MTNAEIMQFARTLEKDLQWDKAAAKYEELLKENPTIAVYERATWCNSRAGDWQRAVELLHRLIELEPRSAKWHYMIGYQYYYKKQWKIAVEWFEKSLNYYPDYFVVKYRLAYAYIQIAGNYKKLTKAEYWKAIDHLRACHKLWNTYNRDKKLKESSTYFDVNFLHGKILMDLPRHRSEAITFFQTALSIKPTDKYARYNLAKTFYLDGEYEKAKENIPSGNDYYIIELTAYVEAKLKNYEKAIGLVRKLLPKRKKDYLYSFLARIYLLNGEPEKAYVTAREAAIIGENNYKNYYTIAQIYHHYNLLDKAIENLQQAIKIKKRKYGTTCVHSEELLTVIVGKKSVDHIDDRDLVSKLEELLVTHVEKSTICHYNSQKGFGFILRSPDNIFFHVSNCKYNDIAVGDSVTFSTTETDKGLSAINVQRCR